MTDELHDYMAENLKTIGATARLGLTNVLDEKDALQQAAMSLASIAARSVETLECYRKAKEKAESDG